MISLTRRVASRPAVMAAATRRETVHGWAAIIPQTPLLRSITNSSAVAASSATPTPAYGGQDQDSKSDASGRYAFTPQGEVVESVAAVNRSKNAEIINFPANNALQTEPLLLNAKEHVVGYLSRILNARVYDAAIESELQHAKNLSTVRIYNLKTSCNPLERGHECIEFLTSCVAHYLLSSLYST
jgi:hypothetical protein